MCLCLQISNICNMSLNYCSCGWCPLKNKREPLTQPLSSLNKSHFLFLEVDQRGTTRVHTLSTYTTTTYSCSMGHLSLFLTCPFCYGAVVRHLLVKRLTIKPLMKMGEPTIPAETADSGEQASVSLDVCPNNILVLKLDSNNHGDFIFL